MTRLHGLHLSAGFLATALLLGGGPAAGQTAVSPAERTGLALTVYSGWGQARDTRTVSASAGDLLVWTGVPATVDPATILPTSDAQPLAVTAQTYDPGEDPVSILRRSEGREAILVWPDGTRQSAVVVSAEGPVFRLDDRLVVGWNGPVEVPDPGGLLEPAIRWRLAEPVRGALTANYLADGLAWSGDYVAVLGEDESSMWLAGHATVRNDTDLAWPDARLELVAGQVRRAGGGPPVPVPRALQREAITAEGVPTEPFADWHLYRIAEPVTLAARTVARATLFAGTTVPVERQYILEGQSWWFQGYHREKALLRPRIRLRFENRDVAGLDAPLPAGTIHTYLRQDSELRFSGSAPVPHTPADEQVEVDVGIAFDLVAERTQTDYRQLDPRTHETAWRVELRNRGRRDRVVTVIERFSGEWTIIEESRSHEQVDAGTAQWRVPVPAGGEAVLTFRVRVIS